MRTCIRCGAEMMDGSVGNAQFGCYFRLGERDFRQYPVKAAICPQCHEISLYMEDGDFDVMTGRKMREKKI